MSLANFQQTYRRLQREAGTFKNLPNVIVKLQNDTGLVLEGFYKTIADILQNETKFTIGGRIALTSPD